MLYEGGHTHINRHWDKRSGSLSDYNNRVLKFIIHFFCVENGQKTRNVTTNSKVLKKGDGSEGKKIFHHFFGNTDNDIWFVFSLSTSSLESNPLVQFAPVWKNGGARSCMKRSTLSNAESIKKWARVGELPPYRVDKSNQGANILRQIKWGENGVCVCAVWCEAKEG